MIVAYFDRCIVCGEDVLAIPDGDLSWCSTHSDADAEKALDHIEQTVKRSREKLQERKEK